MVGSGQLPIKMLTFKKRGSKMASGIYLFVCHFTLHLWLPETFKQSLSIKNGIYFIKKTAISFRTNYPFLIR